MGFEGSEKKAEIRINPATVDLRALGRVFWEDIVRRSQATVLSTISSVDCDAYLLSESSLFVWADRFTMITCGTTRLIDAVVYFVEQHGAQARSLRYQRKNERFPHLQHTDFTDDASRLRALLGGQVVGFGDPNGHRTRIFYHERDGIDASADVTAELSMYGLQGPARALFGGHGGDASRAAARELFSSTGLYRDFQVDDHVFSPWGYSANGLQGDRYWTIHVTPEDDASYASFETNVDLAAYDPRLLEKLTVIFAPANHDIVLFQMEPPGGQVVQGHAMIDFSRQRIGRSVEVRYYHQARLDEGS
ncbi:MAG: adenosylmethionine decarboxylase [Myxococcota bacterium]